MIFKKLFAWLCKSNIILEASKKRPMHLSQCLNFLMIMRIYFLGIEVVTLYEDEFLAGFKPLIEASKPLCKINDIELKV